MVEDFELEEESLLDIGESTDDGQLYEHFRIEVDKGQVPVVVTGFRRRLTPVSSMLTAIPLKVIIRYAREMSSR